MSEHGEPARYTKHLRDGDEVCEPCRDAHRADQRRRLALRPESEATKANRRKLNTIRYGAVRELIARHKDEFHRIYLHLLKEARDDSDAE